MTPAKTNREEYSYTPLKSKKIYLRRTHPRDWPELVIYTDDNQEILVQITSKDQLKGLARDSTAYYFTLPGDI